MSDGERRALVEFPTNAFELDPDGPAQAECHFMLLGRRALAELT
jgi:hypothetical protein